MKLIKLKNKFRFLINTPFHPQWLLVRQAFNKNSSIISEINGNVLDVGCGHKGIKKCLDKNVKYYGLDYYSTATGWYSSSPDIFCNANLLPIKDSSVSNVFMLDVLEHLPDPKRCIKEASRVLYPGGKLLLQVPFLYPLHDVPLDFHRWTKFGFNELLKDTDLTIISIDSVGKPIETAGLILNIALTKTFINAVIHKNPIMLFLIILPFIIPIINIITILLSFLSTDDDFMPLTYKVIAVKK